MVKNNIFGYVSLYVLYSHCKYYNIAQITVSGEIAQNNKNIRL